MFRSPGDTTFPSTDFCGSIPLDRGMLQTVTTIAIVVNFTILERPIVQETVRPDAFDFLFLYVTTLLPATVSVLCKL